jgi:superfamily II DNA or RNA helicase
MQKNIKKDELQLDAINSFNKYYYEEKNTRGILSACCGYGKSYLMYKIIKECNNKHNESLFIIATSRIKLVEQLGPDIEKWSNQEKLNIKFDISILCSDDIYKNDQRISTNKLNIDENKIIDKIIKRKRNIINIFITTYNSAKKIVDKISEYNKKNIDNSDIEEIETDLIILDEAHNTVGSSKKNNNPIQSQKYHHDLFKRNDNFIASKYLFMTATPLILKHKNPNSVINTDETNYSMNNEKMYGNIFYSYSFAQGIKDNVITNFQTLYLELNDEFINKENNKQKFIEDKQKILNLSKEKQETKYFNDICSLFMKYMVKYDFKKTIIYISNQDKAIKFKNILENIKNKIKFDIYKIVSDTPNKQRREDENNFKQSNRAVLIAVNIYNEGVDIPCIDSVMFAEERFSSTTIVQNIGRCLRLDNNNKNKIGYVILPTIIYEFSDVENTYYSSKFKNIRKCIDIIKNKKSKHFYEKYTDNKKNITDNKDNEENENESEEYDTNEEFEDLPNYLEDDKFDNNKLTDKQINDINLLKYFEINGTYNGYISNKTLEDIRIQYIVNKKIVTIKDYEYHINLDKNDQWLRPDIEYRNEWISWDYFLTKNTTTYNESKNIINSLHDFFIITDMKSLLNIQDYFIKCELREDVLDTFEFNNKINKEYDKIYKLKRSNNAKYKELLNKIIKIPLQSQKYYISSGEWISEEDFISRENYKIKNLTGSNKSLHNNVDNTDKNMSNILNNDYTKVKKNKWIIYEKYIISENIKNYLIDNKLFDDKFDLILRYRINKNNIYESSEIIIENKENKNIVGKIILDESKVEYITNLLNKYNIIKEEINLNNVNYLNNTYQNDIDIIITNVKNKIKNDYKINTIIKNDNDININNNYDINNDDIIKGNKNININEDISSLIKKYNNMDDNQPWEKNKLKSQIKKIHKNFGEYWSDYDKQELLNIIKNKNNIYIEDLIKKFGRNEGGIIIQIRKLIEENKINESNINKNILEILLK